MKKLLVIIVVLFIIFIGMFIYQNTPKNNKNVTVEEVNKIETYLQKIYLWKELTGEALTKFEDINEANDLWTWEVVKKNLEEFEVSYQQIEEKAKELFGDNFTKKFPEEGSEFLKYDAEQGIYYATGMGLDQKEDMFLLNKIEKIDNGYKVEIIEYLEDYSNSENEILIQNIQEENISSVTSSLDEAEVDIKQKVKENIDKFSKKIVYLKKDEQENLTVQKVE